MMNPDDPVCLCFHVSRRKVVNFIRIEKPRRASQLSQCFGAGTGCGWCRSYLERLLVEHGDSSLAGADGGRGSSVSSAKEWVAAEGHAEVEAAGGITPEISAADYARSRAEYVRRTGAKLPSGATPVAGRSATDEGSSAADAVDEDVERP